MHQYQHTFTWTSLKVVHIICHTVVNVLISSNYCTATSHCVNRPFVSYFYLHMLWIELPLAANQEQMQVALPLVHLKMLM